MSGSRGNLCRACHSFFIPRPRRPARAAPVAMQRLAASTGACRSLHRLYCSHHFLGNGAEYKEARASVFVATTTTTRTRCLHTRLAPVIRAAADLEPFDYDPRGAGRIGARDVRFCSAAAVSKQDSRLHDASFIPVYAPCTPLGSAYHQHGMWSSQATSLQPMHYSSCESDSVSTVCSAAWPPNESSMAHTDTSQQQGEATRRHDTGDQADELALWLLASHDVHADPDDTTKKHRSNSRDGRPYPTTARATSHGRDTVLATSSREHSQQSATNNADSRNRISSDVACWPVP